VRERFHRRNTPLHRAAVEGHAEVVAALLAHGADVHAKGALGCGGRSLFRATVGVRLAAVADRDEIDARHMWMRAHTHTRTFTRAENHPLSRQ
jgi:ankyrin repeat protein